MIIYSCDYFFIFSWFSIFIFFNYSVWWNDLKIFYTHITMCNYFISGFYYFSVTFLMFLIIKFFIYFWKFAERFVVCKRTSIANNCCSK